ncbi:MAG: hypothetical protein LBN97_02215 [Oscillospiraceae bacterium]|jgi:hypothetical protein|nr:hypothetical protein [Oscillospiraceae bacterium]
MITFKRIIDENAQPSELPKLDMSGVERKFLKARFTATRFLTSRRIKREYLSF